jgi:hypothetical protein
LLIRRRWIGSSGETGSIGCVGFNESNESDQSDPAGEIKNPPLNALSVSDERQFSGNA